MRRPIVTDNSLALRVLVVAISAVYAWWATSVPPFTLRSYLAVGLPAAVLLLLAMIDQAITRGGMVPTTPPDRAQGRQQMFPWVVLFLLAVALEGVGLALGGRSPTVPTFSTVIDHALSQHVERFVLFCGWLVVGWSPFLRSIGLTPTARHRVD